MKKLLAVLAFALLLQGIAMAEFTEHPRYAHIDTKLKAFIQAISDKQAEYFVINGRYFQGIRTPVEPQDGIADADPNWALKPETGQDVSWKDFAPNIFRSNVGVPFQIEIIPISSPEGHSWILMVHVWINGMGPDQFGNDGDHWMYIYGEGPNAIDFEPLNVWHITWWD